MLKPADLDVFGQVLSQVDSALSEDELERQVERFPLVVLTSVDEDLCGFLFGSLERIGGTPCVLWGLGASLGSRRASSSLKLCVEELYRRAAISFPDEDVVVAGRFADPAVYSLVASLDEVVPRPGYKPTGEERAWGRRLAKRFACDGQFDDRSFVASGGGQPAPLVNPGSAKLTTKPATAELLAGIDPQAGDSVVAFGWAMAEKLAGRLSTSGRTRNGNGR